MNIFTPEAFQIAKGHLSDHMLSLVLTAIRQDGYAIIENIVNCKYLDQIGQQMDEDSTILIAKKQSMLVRTE